MVIYDVSLEEKPSCILGAMRERKAIAHIGLVSRQVHGVRSQLAGEFQSMGKRVKGLYENATFAKYLGGNCKFALLASILYPVSVLKKKPTLSHYCCPCFLSQCENDNITVVAL